MAKVSNFILFLSVHLGSYVASCAGFFNFFFFLDYPPRILGGFMWKPQKEPLISNSKTIEV
jgi:hypothetical protein